MNTNTATSAAAPAPVLTHDPAQIADQLKENIAAMVKDNAALTPLLGFALTNLRGALNAIEGHLRASTAAVLLLALMLLGSSASAQVFYGGVPVAGSSNAPVLVNFGPVTNFAYSTLYPRTLVIQNLMSNETLTASWAYQFAGLGGSNLFLMNTLTTNFNGAGLTNGSTVIINLPQQANNVPIQPWGLVTCTNASGNVTNTISLY